MELTVPAPAPAKAPLAERDRLPAKAPPIARVFILAVDSEVIDIPDSAVMSLFRI